MTKEEKSILLKDLCARLPYDVIVQETFQNAQRDTSVWDCGPYYIKGHPEKVKPYLRPMDSMTEEEKAYQMKLIKDIKHGANIDKLEDFYHSHLFDYRGLIPMGLALEATEDMYK